MDEHSKLIVNEDEARQVRAIFKLYLGECWLDCCRRGTGTARLGQQTLDDAQDHQCGGKLFTKTSLHHLLTNVALPGQGQIQKARSIPASTAGIVGPALWQCVQTRLRQNHIRKQPGQARQPGRRRCKGCSGVALKACNCALRILPAKAPKGIVITPARRDKSRGWHTCPSKAVPAGKLEFADSRSNPPPNARTGKCRSNRRCSRPAAGRMPGAWPARPASNPPNRFGNPRHYAATPGRLGSSSPSRANTAISTFVGQGRLRWFTCQDGHHLQPRRHPNPDRRDHQPGEITITGDIAALNPTTTKAMTIECAIQFRRTRP